MRITLWLGMLLLLAGCATPSSRNEAADKISSEMNAAAEEAAKSGKIDAVNNALMPPLTVDVSKADGAPREAKFDLVVSGVSVHQVFMAIVSGTRYSVLLHPEVSGSISLNLKNVTVFEALEVIREMYGYDYKVDGERIYIQPLTMQTRIFQVNYLTGQRDGKSSLRVSSGSIGDSATGLPGAAAAAASSRDSSKVTMTSNSDFWEELSKALQVIVGNEKGRTVVISPMSGVIVIRAMPEELKNVTAYLKASQISIERQVILEAKIIEVTLSDGFQSGVNWAGFKNGPNSHASIGQGSAGSTLTPSAAGAGTLLSNGVLTATPGSSMMQAGGTVGSLFGMAFQTSNFAALLNFLESQGNVHVLSSPRIATLNNQKAVLKVGVDEFFVTEISGGTQATTTVPGTSPTVKVQPFFSGIALDVTPRIDENGEIILHVHPSVSTVTTVNKTVDLGTANGITNKYNLPLASSSVSETDSVVRARDGQIVAIGGLMRQALVDERTGMPGLPKWMFGQTSQSSQKRELVILLKPTVINNAQDWANDITRSRDRLNKMSGQEDKH